MERKSFVLKQVFRNWNCDGRGEKVRKCIGSIRGVDSVTTDTSKDEVIVSGKVDAQTVISTLERKFNRKAVLLQKKPGKQLVQGRPTKLVAGSSSSTGEIVIQRRKVVEECRILIRQGESSSKSGGVIINREVRKDKKVVVHQAQTHTSYRQSAISVGARDGKSSGIRHEMKSCYKEEVVRGGSAIRWTEEKKKVKEVVVNNRAKRG